MMPIIIDIQDAGLDRGALALSRRRASRNVWRLLGAWKHLNAREAA